MRRRTLALALIVASVCLASTTADTLPVMDVEVVVHDQEGRPVEDARVALDGEIRAEPPDCLVHTSWGFQSPSDLFITDSAGRAHLERVPQGQHEIWAVNASGAAVRQAGEVTCDTVSREVRLVLDPLPVRGRVVDHRGREVAGVDICYVYPYRGGDIFDPLTQTDSQGRFALPWYRGTLGVEGQGYPDQRFHFTLGEQPTFQLRPAIGFRGRVLDEQSHPVEDAWIMLEERDYWDDPADNNFARHRWFGATDADGRFHARGLHEGHWDVAVWRRGVDRQYFGFDLPTTRSRDFWLGDSADEDVRWEPRF